MILPKPLRYVWSAWGLLWTAITTVCFSIMVLVSGWLGMGQDRLHALARFWARLLIGGVGCRVRVKGLENLEPGATYVFASNHASSTDILALLAALPANFRWIAKKELFAIPVFGSAMRKAGYIPIDRSDNRAAMASLQLAARRIREGSSVIIFPEGTRTLDGRLLPFKSGGFLLALRSGRPVVPVAIVGTHEALPAKSLLINPGPIEVRLGRPLPTAGLKAAQREQLCQATREQVLGLLGTPEG
jgi:1-acyl-sn-glycerol-3-phosphate acyltransferase